MSIDVNAKVTLLPILTGRHKPIVIRKTNQRYRVKLNEDIEMVKSLSFDCKVNDLLDQKRSIRLTIESIDRNQDIITKRSGPKKNKEKQQHNTGSITSTNANANDNSNTHPHSPCKTDRTFQIKEDSLHHILKIESEKQFEVDLSAKTKQLASMKTERDYLNHKMDRFQSQVSNLSLDIELLKNFPKYATKSSINSSIGDEDISPTSKSKKDRQIAFEKMNVLVKGFHKKNEKREQLENEKKDLIVAIEMERENYEQLKAKITVVKSDIKQLKSKMKDYYQVLLYKGTDYRQEGLACYIKAIWNLGFDVDLSFMPSFLDKKCIDYLFLTAKKSIEITALRQKISETKMKHSKELKGHLSHFQFETVMACKPNSSMNKLMSQYTDAQSCKEEKLTVRKINTKIANKPPLDDSILLVFAAMNKLSFRLNQLEMEMITLREREIKRITKEYIVNDYENKYGASIEQLVSALVGEVYKDKELNHYSHIRSVCI